jgi:tetratricopeptide (TPR) repeat protein
VEVAAFDPTDRVAVLPFSYRGDDEYGYLGEGMVDLLSRTLDGAGELRAVDPHTVFLLLRQQDDSDSLQAARSLAALLNVGKYVVGNVVEAGGRLQFTARLYSARDTTVEPVHVSVQGPPDSLFSLIGDLTARLLLSEGDLGTLVRVEALTTESLEALKAYLQGERSYRANRSGDAQRAFEQAVEIDSTFALAWYRLSRLTYFSGSAVGQVPEYAEAADRHAGQLPWRERQLLRANRAFARGAARESQRIYGEVLRRYPDDAEAWWGLAILLSEYSRFLGLPATAARSALRRVLSYEPDHALARSYLALDEAEAGNWQVFDSIIHVMYGDSTPDLPLRLIRAVGTDDAPEKERVLAEVENMSVLWAAYAMHLSNIIAGSPSSSLQFLAIAERGASSPQVEAIWNLFAVGYELGRGRRIAAGERFSRLRQLNPAWAIVDEALWALAPHMPTQRAELESWRTSLEHWEAAAVAETVATEAGWAWPMLFHRQDGANTHLRHYLLGRLNARLGEYDEALRYADELEQMPPPPDGGSLSRDLAQSVRANVHLEQGDLKGALRALEAAPGEVDWTRRYHSVFTQGQERFLRAELLAALGRDEEALRWYQSVGYEVFPALTGPSRLRQAEMHERLGEPDEAVVQYKRFIELWSNCDPEFRPLVEAAQQALERLTAEPRTD